MLQSYSHRKLIYTLNTYSSCFHFSHVFSHFYINFTATICKMRGFLGVILTLFPAYFSDWQLCFLTTISGQGKLQDHNIINNSSASPIQDYQVYQLSTSTTRWCQMNRTRYWQLFSTTMLPNNYSLNLNELHGPEYGLSLSKWSLQHNTFTDIIPFRWISNLSSFPSSWSIWFKHINSKICNFVKDGCGGQKHEVSNTKILSIILAV